MAVQFTNFSGGSITSTPFKVITNFSGMSVSSLPFKVITGFSGLSVLSQWTIRVRIFDSVTLNQLNAGYTLVNNTDPIDPLSNFVSSGLFDHFIQVGFSSNLEFSLNVVGYIPKIQNLSFDINNGFELLDIFLDPTVNTGF